MTANFARQIIIDGELCEVTRMPAPVVAGTADTSPDSRLEVDICPSCCLPVRKQARFCSRCGRFVEDGSHTPVLRTAVDMPTVDENELESILDEDVNVCRQWVLDHIDGRPILGQLAAKRFNMWCLAANLNLPAGQFLLGVCYEFGQGVDIVPQSAVAFYAKAAKQGCSDAEYSLGVCLMNGIGIATDTTAAFRCFRDAAESGHAGAQFFWGLHLCEMDLGGSTILTPNIRDGLLWMREAVKGGHKLAAQTWPQMAQLYRQAKASDYLASGNRHKIKNRG